MVEDVFSLVGCSIEFTNDRTIRIVDVLGSGATSVAYKCEIYIDGKITSYGILKEYRPITYLKEQTILTYSVKMEGTRYVSRYLPAQEANFKKDYKEYIKSFENIRNILNRLIREDPTIKKYVVELPCPADCFFELNEDEGTYVALQLYPFDFDSNMENIIKTMTMQQRLEMLEELCLIIDKFHQNHLLVCDLKPENFIYINDGITSSYRFFDFDSFKQLNEKYELSGRLKDGTAYFSAPEMVFGGCFYNRSVDVYSIGAILLYLVCYDIFPEIVPDTGTFGWGELEEISKKIGDNTRRKLFEVTQDGNVTIGFWNKFTDIVLRCMAPVASDRCKKSEISPMKQVHLELVSLREIYKNKGVHPQVMLNNAIKQAEKNDKRFDLSIFDE